MSWPHPQLSQKVLHLSFSDVDGGVCVDIKLDKPKYRRAAKSNSEKECEKGKKEELINNKFNLVLRQIHGLRSIYEDQRMQPSRLRPTDGGHRGRQAGKLHTQTYSTPSAGRRSPVSFS